MITTDQKRRAIEILMPLAKRDLTKVFCPTGPGGGIDPTCSPGEGSRTAKNVGEKFASMPMAKATSKEAKKWRKQMQEHYDNDPEFRAVVDSVSLFTQGDYQVQRAYSEKAVTGKLPEKWDDSVVPEWADRPLHGNALAAYKEYFEGQGDFDEKPAAHDKVTYNEAGRALTQAIHDSPVIDSPLFRGLVGRHAVTAFSELKEGDDFNIHGASSFTVDADLAEQFSEGVAKGQGTQRDRNEYNVLIEVRAGAKAMNVAALSPWDQKEMLTQGKFKIEKIEVKRNRYDNPKNVKIELLQVHTWEPKK